MRNNYKRYFLGLAIIAGYMFIATTVKAQELFFTYMGVVFQGGTNSISYESWINNEHGTVKSQGYVYGGGIITAIFVHQFVGEFSLTYMQYSSNTTPNLSVRHSLVTVKGKYFYPLSNVYQPGIGMGLYLDLPPASVDYNGGAGANISLCSLFTFSSEIKALIDIYAQYGSFGMGESSIKIEGGISLGVVYKVGRL